MLFLETLIGSISAPVIRADPACSRTVPAGRRARTPSSGQRPLPPTAQAPVEHCRICGCPNPHPSGAQAEAQACDGALTARIARALPSCQGCTARLESTARSIIIYPATRRATHGSRPGPAQHAITWAQHSTPGYEFGMIPAISVPVVPLGYVVTARLVHAVSFAYS